MTVMSAFAAAPHRPWSGHPALAAAALAVIAWPSAPTIARASCASPPLDLLWAYPEDGATDVPTNAVFWLVNSRWSALPTATLDGVELEPVSVTFGGSKIEPGQLEPNTDYVLALDYGEHDADAGEASSVRIAFGTGSGPADRPPAPRVSSSSTSDTRPATELCRKVLAAQDCFDTGQDTLLTFEVEDDEAIAWLVLEDYLGESTVWPASCGEPSLMVGGAATVRCKDVSAIGPGGVLGATTRYCPQSSTPDAGRIEDAGRAEQDGGVHSGRDAGTRPPGRRSIVGEGGGDASDGCSAGGTPRSAASGPWMIALLAFAFRARARTLRRSGAV